MEKLNFVVKGFANVTFQLPDTPNSLYLLARLECGVTTTSRCQIPGQPAERRPLCIFSWFRGSTWAAVTTSSAWTTVTHATECLLLQYTGPTAPRPSARAGLEIQVYVTVGQTRTARWTAVQTSN